MVEPFGEEWTQTALIAQTVANGMRKRRTPFKIEDFMPKVVRPRKRQTVAESLAAFRVLAAKNDENDRGYRKVKRR